MTVTEEVPVFGWWRPSVRLQSLRRLGLRGRLPLVTGLMLLVVIIVGRAGGTPSCPLRAKHSKYR